MNKQQQEALDEVQAYTMYQLHAQTAMKWAYRAWAANFLSLNLQALEYEHEAVEHAALSGNDHMLVVVRRVIATGE